MIIFLVPRICRTEKDDCHPTLATCKDTGPGRHKCTCNAGYFGDGKTCARMCLNYLFIGFATDKLQKRSQQ